MSNRTVDPGTFQSRHIGPDDAEAREMLTAIGASSLEALVDEAVPARIRLDKALNLPDGMPEQEPLVLSIDKTGQALSVRGQYAERGGGRRDRWARGSRRRCARPPSGPYW